MFEKFSLKNILTVPLFYNYFQLILGNNKALPVYVNNFIKPEKGNKILDIGCGTAYILNFLPEVDYTGFDLNSGYIDYAKANYSAKGKFFCSKVTKETVTELSSFDIVLATSILHHLDDKEAYELFNLAYSALKPGGRLITLDGCYTDKQSPIAKFILSKDRGSFVRNEKEYFKLANSVFDNINITIKTDLIYIPYTHIIMECTKEL